MAEGSTQHPVRKRQLKNLLLDRRFQLKYAGYLVGVAFVLSATLGTLLWRTSTELIELSNQSVDQGREIVALGEKVTKESRKVSAVVEMNIVKEYGDTPELLATFKDGTEETKRKLDEQQSALETQAAALERQSSALASKQQIMLISLTTLLTLLVLGVGLIGIVVTHKVAGPIFKMTRQINEVAEGRWTIPDPLRKGDELTSFFGAFDTMIRSLRERREHHIAILDAAIENLARQDAQPEELERLEQLRAELSEALDG